jgi:hypothetical protein
MSKKDFQLLRCLFGVDVIYIIFSICSSFYYGYIAATNNQVESSMAATINNFLETFLTVFSFVPCCVNFFIFICMSKAFRNEIKRFIYKIIGKYLVILREEDNRRNNIQLNVVNIVVTSP